jgi:molecular chaperone DnaJ
MAKDYYVILGISPDATAEQIKSAYRREAKRCHPDMSGAGSEPFLDLREAYEVLADAGRRRAYDEEMARERLRYQQAARPEPLRRSRCPVEPLVPEREPAGYGDDFYQSPFSSPGFQRPWSEPQSPFRPETAEEAGDWHVTVTLSRQEARRGGRLRVWIPAQVRCPACGGRGWAGLFECVYCFGRGTVFDEYPQDIVFAGGVVDGAKGSVSLGRGEVILTVHFRVQG